MKRSTKKGFTLAELLIVIAIIAVLIAIMFPVFGAQVDKAKAAAELANVRAKYAELVADEMLGGTNMATPISSVTVKLSDLKAARNDTANTKVTAVKANAQPTAYDAATMGDPTANVALATGDPAGTAVYVVVVYKDTYIGSFEIDEDVTISKD